MKKLLVFTLCAYAHAVTYSQSLPDEMYFSPNGQILYTGGQPTTGLFDPTQIRSYYLNFTQLNYWSQLVGNYNSKTDLAATLMVDATVLDSVGVRFKGATSYMGTSNSEKKSFNISMDGFVDDQDLMGYETVNLNNCYDDASFLREWFYLNQIRNHIPAAKSSIAKLYINGENWGVYPAIQQLDKKYLKEWFMNNDGTNWRADAPSGGGPGGPGGGWGDGTAAINYLGNDTSDYQQYYTLKSTNQTQPWDDLVTACHVLDTTSSANMEAIVNDYIDIDRTLWFLGSEILFSDDDSYVHKGKMDYYAYYDEVTGRLTPLEYDGNSVMLPNAVNWSPFYHETNANYPLLNKLLAVPSIRQRYLAHLRTLISEELDSASAIGILENMRVMIDTMVQNDTKKLYSYSAFTTEVAELKTFVVNRRNNLNGNAEVNKVPPVISNVNFISQAGAWTSPAAGEAVSVTASASSVYGIDHLDLYYATEVYGKFTKTSMYDDGLHGDGAASDGVYGGTIPGQAGGLWIRFYVGAVAANVENTVAYSPAGAEHNVYVFQVNPSVAANINVTINEIMASNNSTATDSAFEYDDWIELYNLTAQPQDLSGFYITDNSLNFKKWEFPAGSVIAPNDYMILWADEDGSQGDLHMNFKLSGSGEHLMLLNSNLEIVDDVTFGTQIADIGYARVPNGTGPFVSQNPTFSASNDLGTAVMELIKKSTLTLYPNPANDILKIFTGTDEKSDLQVFNNLGELVFSENVIEQIEINTSEWIDGIYVVRIGDSMKKIIIQH